MMSIGALYEGFERAHDVGEVRMKRRVMEELYAVLPVVRGHVKRVVVKERKLFVEVNASVLRHTLHLHKGILLERLQQGFIAEGRTSPIDELLFL